MTVAPTLRRGAPIGLRLRRPPHLGVLFWVASSTIAVVVAAAIVVPLLPGMDPLAQNLSDAQLPPFSPGHVLGTDALGRDVLARVTAAGRTSLALATLVVAINMLLGVLLGMVAGYFRGATDHTIMGLADIQLAVPVLLLLIALIGALGASFGVLAVVLGLTFWVQYARVARVTAMALRERDFVSSARVQGASAAWVIRKHLAPAILPQMAVLAAFDFGVIIVAESSLSYLGLGIPAPTPSWGGMIAEGQPYLQTNPWLCIVPGLMIFVLLAGVQIVSRQLTGENEGGEQG